MRTSRIQLGIVKIANAILDRPSLFRRIVPHDVPKPVRSDISIALQNFFFQSGSVTQTCEAARAGRTERTLCELIFAGNHWQRIGSFEGVFQRLIYDVKHYRERASYRDFLSMGYKLLDRNDGRVRRIYEVRPWSA